MVARDDDLRQRVLTVLDLQNVSKEAQDDALYRVESIAQARLGRLLTDLLTDEQLKHVEAMQDEGKDDAEIIHWVEDNLPHYNELLGALVEDVASEAAGV